MGPLAKWIVSQVSEKNDIVILPPLRGYCVRDSSKKGEPERAPEENYYLGKK
jgi:hypothetical protein